MSRIGIYGGSFNPPHVGHTLAAKELIRLFSLDRLLVIPASQPPHKQLPEGSPSPAQRLELVRTAFSEVPGAEVSDIELRRDGPSYTVDTLAQLREQYPGDELILTMGTDMLLSFSTWRCPDRIAALASLGVMHRSSSDAVWKQVTEEARSLERQFGATVLLAQNDCVDVSSTTVRRLIALGAPAYLPPGVEEMITENGWYLAGADLKQLPYDRLEPLALSLHDEKRRAHVLGCSETAVRLAARWGADEALARRAGILHDITKALNGASQLILCEKYDMMLSSLERKNPKLLHAKTGAVVARQVFGECEAVCSAICWHTTGRPAMTTLEKIIYLADYVEPNRRFEGVETLRALTQTDLDAAMHLGLSMSIAVLRHRGSQIDDNSRQALAYYENERSRSS